MAKSAYDLIKSFCASSTDSADGKDYLPAVSGTRANIIGGIGVIGKLLAIAGTATDAADEIESEDLADLGWFLSCMAQIHEGLVLAEDNINFSAQEHHSKEALRG
ncbi:hypothetical protein [Plesiomonas shigelloides]|uniref:hypothetical protein n=1 Tax=Plesiomonas shigelloides TaxID=703 RepID=UPI00126199BC|nr:hypothetical protein [Plesiomonas shigelloides]KAB7676551.1 hypothetical protein GBN16_08200 [Plesiomonas shigelloides]